MQDEKKTKKDLIKELTDLRGRVAELEKLEADWKDTQLDLSERMGHYFTLVDQSSDAIFVIFDRKFEFVNQRFEELFNVKMDEVCNPDFNPLTLIAPESRNLVLENIQKGFRGTFSSQQFEFAALTKEGRKIECETTILFIPYKWGIAVHGVLHNVTMRKRIDEELQRERSDLQLVLNSIPTSTYYTDRNHRFIQINEAFSKSLGRPIESILGKTISDLFPNLPSHQVQHYYQDNNDVISSGHPKRGIIEMYPSTRGHCWLQTDKTPYHGDDGSILGVISLSIDISEFRKTEEKLWYLSFHDVLTGLYNRAYFEEEVVRHEHGRLFPISIVVITVDNLISVNASHGIEAGNELLKRTSQLLKVFRSEDIVARIGGNKFAAILPLSDGTIGENVVARLRDGLSARSNDYRDLSLALSFGVATGQKGCSLYDILKQAEMRMSKQEQ
ncbi:MAG TPA: PAS domain S-box protein [Syntrophales bacterium]|nr:PAS domain S-box protein [Syntrophales bacterium]